LEEIKEGKEARDVKLINHLSLFLSFVSSFPLSLSLRSTPREL